MIISLTEKCSEGCSHCMINSLPRSPSMSKEVLEKVCAFTSKMKNYVFLVSGGEFSEHPEFKSYCLELFAANKGKNFLLLSNGSWFFDEPKRQDMLALLKHPSVLGLQVRTHKKYYPNFKRTSEAFEGMQALHSKIKCFEDSIQLISLGRAKANFPAADERKFPSCSNLFLLAKQAKPKDFSELIASLDLMGKFCSPFMDSQGVFHAGETPYCENIGTLDDSQEQIIENILTRCKPKNVCGLVKNFTEQHRVILGIK